MRDNKPLPIYFDATRLRARRHFEVPTGIDRVDLAYLQALGSDAALQLTLVAQGPLGLQRLTPAAARRLMSDLAQHWHAPQPTASPLWRALQGWLELPKPSPRPALPKAARAKPKMQAAASPALHSFTAVKPNPSGLYINTSHGQLYRGGVARWLRRTGMQGLFFVHDLIPIEHPEYSRPAEPARHAARLATIAAHARAVLVNSAATQQSLEAYWSARNVRMPVIAVAPLGVGLHLVPNPLPAPQATRPYFVLLGTIEPRKNHLMILKLWRQLVETDPLRAPRLVLVGRRGWENETVFNLLDRAPRLASHVMECPGLADTELLALLRGARALLNPSFAEGFGLPVAEALAAGVPVLASSLAAHREVGGACAEYLDPLDGMGWLQAINDYTAEPSPRRNTALQGLGRYSAPSWAQHFEIVRAQLHAPA